MSSSLAIKVFKNPKQHKFTGIPKALPNKHFTALFIGSRGSGKSTVMRNIIDKYRKVFPVVTGTHPDKGGSSTIDGITQEKRGGLTFSS